MTTLTSAAIGALEVQVRNAQEELYQIRLALATMKAEAEDPVVSVFDMIPEDNEEPCFE